MTRNDNIITKPSETIAAYYTNVLYFNNLDNIVKARTHNSGTSFYNLLKNSSAIQCILDHDNAFNIATSRAQQKEMPAYLYEFSIPNTAVILDLHKQFPDNKKEFLKKLLTSEHLHDGKIYIECIISAIDNKAHSIDDILYKIHQEFSKEHTIRIMKTIGIDGVYEEDRHGKKAYMSIFNRDIITEIKRQHIMTPVHDKKFNAIHYDTPKEYIDDVFEQKEQYNLKKRHDFDPSLEPNLEPKLYKADFHYPLYSSEHMHGLQNDPHYKDFMFRNIKQEFQSYSSAQFTQDIKPKQRHVSHSNVSVSLPQTLDDLDHLINATAEHISSDKIDKMKQGTMQATQLKIRPSDQKMFVLKEHSKSQNKNFITGIRDVMSGHKIGDKSKACQAEYEAYQIYEAFGVSVPKTHLIEEKERTILVMEYIEGHSLNDYVSIAENMSDIEYLESLRDKIAYDFPIDALLCNPDTGYYHSENIILDEKSLIPKRIDMGFALDYHAEGFKKSGNQWTKPQINDFYDFRHGGITAEDHYGGLTNNVILNRLEQAKECLENVKKVAQPRNFTIIEKRLELALSHFQQLCKIEAEFKENKNSLNLTKNIQQSVKKEEPITGLKYITSETMKTAKKIFGL